MIIYVQNRAFPHKTFVTSVQPNDKVARVRAQLFHILYELGKDDHQFRLRYKGQILRDAFSMKDYSIPDNAIVTMVPVGESQEVLMEIHSVLSSDNMSDLLQKHGQLTNIQTAVRDEVKTFDHRERMLVDLKALLYLHFLFMFLSLLSVHWYSALWLFVCWSIAMWFIPTYSRAGGFVGNTYHLKTQFCIGGLILSTLCLVPTMYFCVSGWIFVATSGCSVWMFEGHCSHLRIYTSALFTLHFILLIFTIIMMLIMLQNFQVKVGDFIEKFLIQDIDVDKVILMASSRQIKDQRAAAYDLAGMATESDDNKFRIVAEGGLAVLTTLALSCDEVTQEHAVEALTELLTIPSIQYTFVESNSMGSLTALLCSNNSRVMQEAAVAIYNMVVESDRNKHAVIIDQGLDDLSYVAHAGNAFCQRTVASIYQELVFNTDIRTQVASVTTAQTLVSLCKSSNPDTVRFALQSLEVLAIESSDLICSQEDLIGLLLDLPFRSMDEKLYLLAGKILLYFAQNEQTCKDMLNNPSTRNSLTVFAKSADPILQKVIIKIISASLDYPNLRSNIQSLNVTEMLEYLRDFSTDRETLEMASVCLKALKAKEERSKISAIKKQ